jgi:hypothetical protein
MGQALRKIPQCLRIIGRAFCFGGMPLYRCWTGCRITTAFDIRADSFFTRAVADKYHDKIPIATGA